VTRRDHVGAWAVALTILLRAVPLGAQAFHPPPVGSQAGGTKLGLLGFGLRVGADFSGQGQAVLGGTIDAGSLFTDRLRLRPSAEIGILNGANTYAGSLELVYRFAADHNAVVPYTGGGVALAGHAECGSDSGCPGVWVNVVVGFEVRYRSTFNWLLEYHAMDAFRHNRLYVGLTSRRGN